MPRLSRLLLAALTLLLAAPAAAQTGLPAGVTMLPDDAIVYVPTTLAPGDPPPPLLVLLHGGDRRPDLLIRRFAPEAETRHMVLLAPVSKGGTWDVILRAMEPPTGSSLTIAQARLRFSHTPDGDRVLAAIAALRTRLATDPARTVLAGFSDGASFALALGMSRDLALAGVIGWSPGIPITPARPARGRTVLVSHGRQDPVLPYISTCRDIVPQLRAQGARVGFRPFEGVHQIPAAVASEFLDALLGPAPGAALHPLQAEDRPSCAGGAPER